MQKVLINFLVLLIVFFTSGCVADQTKPLNVTFKNASLFGSPNYAITVCYAEDKRLHEYYTDILIKSNTPNANITIGKELDSKTNIEIIKQNQWYSLTKLLNQEKQFNLTTFKRAQTTTFLLSSNQELTLNFKAVGGNLALDMQKNEEFLTNLFDVSKNFELILKNHL